ncbi:MAG: cupredoxin family copper-binding protein [Proteobacteria bacterium]|nr:cupredoxin family copper-binding protein [Pseudomonadota bacterium]MBS0572115.1 cupredoxin family copper-binding protein [Pseudomonadota bacterium]
MTGFANLRLFACALAVCGPILLTPAHAADAPHVRIANFSFEPETLNVKAGTTVVFENDDDIPHLIVADDQSFRSKALDTGDTYAFTFSKPGDFAYFCGLHPHMQGKITVSP